ncbi:allograft inflammatory factor 1-like [Ylistrum balloti]|uniref:allograft inflammatory factor 1-like n=1 Tax=Ylistrum balloti TaxID=509963 RepID=UPI002905DB81|nr:allograft inflammatory factor 1-like [Ylistrum balloti]
METPILDPNDRQGGKAFGLLMEEKLKLLEKINEEFKDDDTYKEMEDLEEKLNQYKEKFLEFDLDNSGDIDLLALTRMLERLNATKTHLDVKKIMDEVDTTGTGTISYKEFVTMMLGGKKCILRLILFFESAGQEPEKQKGVAPPRTLDSLP